MRWVIAIGLFLAAAYAITKSRRGGQRRQDLPYVSPIRIEVQLTPDRDIVLAKSEEIDVPTDDRYINNYWITTDRIQRPAAANLQLKYQSTNGNVTDRRFELRTFERGSEGCMMHGWCYLRSAERSLSSPAVLEAIDLDSGELITDLPSYLERRYAEHPDRAGFELRPVVWDAFAVLVYVARADGAMRAPEREIIAKYFESVPVISGISKEQWQAALSERGTPTKYDFYSAARALAGTSYDLDTVHACVRAIVDTQKVMHSEEERVLLYLARTWKGRISAPFDKTASATPKTRVRPPISDET